MPYPNEVLHVMVNVPHLCGDQFVITGDRATINYIPQHPDGTSVTVAGGSAPGPVTVSGSDGSTVGSQTASGTNSDVTARRTVQDSHDAVVTGRNTSATSANDQPMKERWWARLRKRGMLVAFAAIIGAIAAVVHTAVAVCVWIGWTP